MIDVFVYTYPQRDGASLLFLEEEPSEKMLVVLTSNGDLQVESKILTFKSRAAALAAGIVFSDPDEFFWDDDEYDEPLGEEYDD